MWMHTVLHKEEIQVNESKVVVRDGRGVIGDLLHVFTRQKTLWLVPILWANALKTTRKQGVKSLGKVLEGSEGAYKQVSDRRGKVL